MIDLLYVVRSTAECYAGGRPPAQCFHRRQNCLEWYIPLIAPVEATPPTNLQPTGSHMNQRQASVSSLHQYHPTSR